MKSKQKITCLMGPTASGKTALSLKLARELNAEIVSVDSRQVYVGMDIGTAKEKPRPKFDIASYQDLWKQPYLINGIPHFLLDICLPSDRYTAFDFKRQAEFLIEDIYARGKHPLFVGGTGLYFDALLYDYQPAQKASYDLALRAALENRYEHEGGDKLWQELKEIDPLTAEKIHPNNPRHLIRAIEHYTVTGKPKSAANQKTEAMVYDAKLIAIDWPRAQLYKRIEKRIDMQLQQGLLDEVKQLRAKYDHDLPAMTSIGYRELGQFLDGELDFETAVDLFKKNTRNYAKRQLTWFRRYEEMEWVTNAQ